MIHTAYYFYTAVIGFLLPMFEVIRGESSDVCVGLLGGSLSTSVTINLLIINTNCSTNSKDTVHVCSDFLVYMTFSH